MLAQPIQKPKRKKKRINKVPKAVMDIVKERSEGICEDCNRARANDPHHIRLKSQGGLDIPINILYVCRTCHNHDDIDFLNKAKNILRDRINQIFFFNTYTLKDIAMLLEMDYFDVRRQADNYFLEDDYVSGKGNIPTKESIQRWLTGCTW